MAEGTREGADDGKAEPLPQLDRGLVRRDHEVELHGPIAEAPCLFQAMLTHSPADAEATSRGRDHKSGVGHVRTQAGLIGFQNIGPDHPALTLGDIGSRTGMEPIR
jgi:hypothetical protein